MSSEEDKTTEIQLIKENNKLNIVIDMSSYDLFEMCKARYNYRHNLLKAPPVEQKSVALDRGSLIHEGYDIYYSMLRDGQHFNDRVHAAVKRIQFFSSDPDQCNLEQEDVNFLIKVVEENLDYWRFEDEQMEILEVERAFAYPLYEDSHIRIILTGKIDLLVNIHGVAGRASYTNLPIDHKTYQRDFPVPELSNQFMNYCNAVKSNFLIVNRIGLQKTLKPEEKYKRIPISYDPFMLEDWKKDVIHTILEEYIGCISSGYWKRNFTSCFKFNRPCEYYDICKTSGEDEKLRKLESQFASVSPWDVTAKFNKG